METKGERQQAGGESNKQEGGKKEEIKRIEKEEREKKEKEREKNVKENPWWEQKKRWEQQEFGYYDFVRDLRDLSGKEIEISLGVELQEKSFKELYAFTAQICGVFRQIVPHDYIKMSGETIDLVRDYVFIICSKIMSEVESICQERGGVGGGEGGGEGEEREKIWMRDIDEAIDRQFPAGGELSLNYLCKNEPKKTLQKITTKKAEQTKEEREEEEKKEEKDKDKEICQRFQRSKSAGLVLSIDLIEEMMKIKYSFKNMEEGLAVYMTSLIEYLTAEILELTYNCWYPENVDVTIEKEEEEEDIIFPEYVEKAIQNDAEFCEYFKDGMNIKG